MKKNLIKSLLVVSLATAVGSSWAYEIGKLSMTEYHIYLDENIKVDRITNWYNGSSVSLVSDRVIRATRENNGSWGTPYDILIQDKNNQTCKLLVPINYYAERGFLFNQYLYLFFKTNRAEEEYVGYSSARNKDYSGNDAFIIAYYTCGDGSKVHLRLDGGGYDIGQQKGYLHLYKGW